jgi:hypothetical protein
VALSGLAQVNVNVDEAWSHDQPTGVEGFVALAAQLAGGGNLSDMPVFEQKIVLALELLGRIDQVPLRIVNALKAIRKTLLPQMNADER